MAWFSRLSLKAKVSIAGLLIFLPAMLAGTLYFSSEVQKYVVLTAAGGLMNFADAKQQGVIRFLGQNEKLAKSLLVLAKNGSPEATRSFFRALVKNDVFDVAQHPFQAEIESGKRHIPTLRVYHSIDHVRGGKIVVSSDPAREGRPWIRNVNLAHGYSAVYLENGEPVVSFGAMDALDAVYVHADALMLTNIVNGEIGNLEGDMGAFYLAGVGRTFDYYMVNDDNKLITESRVDRKAILKRTGSRFPWQATLQSGGVKCGGSRVYTTNVGAVTGCREAMGYYTSDGGKQMLGASMPFYDSNWTLVVEQEADELFEPLYELFKRMGLMGAGLALISALLFVFVINFYLFRPLRKTYASR
jgi:hypothetical protein